MRVYRKREWIGIDCKGQESSRLRRGKCDVIKVSLDEDGFTSFKMEIYLT